MPEHFTKSTTEAKFWCVKCHKPTMHYVSDGRRGGCQECIRQRDVEREARQIQQESKARQQSLFEGRDGM